MKGHLKRIAAPKSWTIKRKERKWLVRNACGAHTAEQSIPLAVLIRDLLKYAKTMREVKHAITKSRILVNGKRAKDEKLPVGMMDVISFQNINEQYRILIDKKGKIFAKKIEKKSDGEIKPFRIINKTRVKDRVQLNLSSGNNVLVDKDTYRTGDTLIISLDKKEIKQHLKLEKSAAVYLTAGARIGELGTVESIDGKKIVLKIGNKLFETLKEYAFVVGKEKPAIEI